MRKIDADAFYARVAPECKFPELLKAQLDAEPTVEERLQKPMTLEEVKEQKVVCLELLRVPNIEAVAYRWETKSKRFKFSKFDRCGYELDNYLPMEQYGKTWRCWATKPTDEERRAAEWKVE